MPGDHGPWGRTFTSDDQEWFVTVSGDRNPIHVDRLQARRLMFGQPVVHGMHAALWAIDAVLRDRPCGVARLRVDFRQPILVDEHVEVTCDAAVPGEIHLEVARGGIPLASIGLSLRSGEGVAGEPTEPVDDRPRTDEDLNRAPRTHSEADLRDARGIMRVAGGDQRLRAAFPALSDAVGSTTVSHLAALSRLVGMECPGLHSIFTGFDVHVVEHGVADRLSWEVVRTIPHLAAVRIKITDGRLRGTVNAFVRPAPVTQPTSQELRVGVTPGEFAGVHALVAGGSRGLGELAAKLIAAGGGTPTVTWNTGQQDAQAVVDDITRSGGHADLARLDIADPLTGLTATPNVGRVSHLLYFPSPRITGRRTEPFDAEHFDHLTSAYVHGFLRTVKALHHITGAEVHAFYPSTVYVDEVPSGLIEYAASKTVGELAAREAAAGYPWLTVDIERLPRLETDQTASLTSDTPVDTPAVLLAVLRRFVRPIAGAGGDHGTGEADGVDAE